MAEDRGFEPPNLAVPGFRNRLLTIRVPSCFICGRCAATLLSLNRAIVLRHFDAARFPPDRSKKKSPTNARRFAPQRAGPHKLRLLKLLDAITGNRQKTHASIFFPSLHAPKVSQHCEGAGKIGINPCLRHLCPIWRCRLIVPSDTGSVACDHDNNTTQLLI